MKIIIKNGKIIDPAQQIRKKADILVEKGKIVAVKNSIKDPNAISIDAKDQLVVPGFIDMHTHLREPGREDKETVLTGLKAAAKGGFTAVCAMPNTDPPCDNQAQVKFLIEKSNEAKLGEVLPVGTITKNREGRDISEMKDLKDAGVRAVSDDGDPVADSSLMRRAMEYASMLDLLVISHCEDQTLADNGVMHEGYWSTVLGLAPIPAAAESIIVDRDIKLAELTGARLHIAHVSTAESVEIIRKAKKRGINVTAEVTPHHITLRDEDLKTYNTLFKVNPPLRTAKDVLALKKGLEDGTIDVIATDHAPHLESEKEKEFDYAPFGMIGLETALSLCVTALIDEKYLDWPALVEKLAFNPARILGYPGGTLKEGAPANITVIDPEKEWVYEKDTVNSLSSNSPFLGWKLKAMVTNVVAGGRVIVKEGAVV